MDLTEAKRFIECEKGVGGVHPHPEMVQSLVTEIKRLRAELERIEQYPTSETLAASTKPMQLLAHLARENKALAQSLLDEFDAYRRYVKGLDDKLKRLQAIAKQHRETAEAYRDKYQRVHQAIGHILTIVQEAEKE